MSDVAVISDDFTRADSATSLGTASDGGTWSVEGGTHGISSDQAYLVTASGGTTVNVKDAVNFTEACYIAYRDSLVSLCDVSYDVSRSSASNNNVGVIFANLDPSTTDCYYLAYTGDGWGTIGYTSGGTPHGWQGGGGVMPSIVGSPGTIRFQITGSGGATAYFNGSSIIVASGMPTITGSRVGHGAVTASLDRWDNFSALTISPSPPRFIVAQQAAKIRAANW